MTTSLLGALGSGCRHVPVYHQVYCKVGLLHVVRVRSSNTTLLGLIVQQHRCSIRLYYMYQLVRRTGYKQVPGTLYFVPDIEYNLMCHFINSRTTQEAGAVCT